MAQGAHDKSRWCTRPIRRNGIKAIETNLQVSSPPIYLTGYLEFQDASARTCPRLTSGSLPAKDVLPKTEDEWKSIIRRTGRSKLKEEIASYKAVMPKATSRLDGSQQGL